MRLTKSQTKSRRSHHALKAPRLSTDKETGSVHLRHRADMKTGMYRGRKVFEVEKADKKTAHAHSHEHAKDDFNKKEVIKDIHSAKKTKTDNIAKETQRRTQGK